MYKTPPLLHVKKRLDFWAKRRNNIVELSPETTPDPLQVAAIYNDEYIALVCALFAYGNAKMIVKFLSSLDFSLLNSSEEEINKNLKNRIYRFQNSKDVVEFFITLNRLKKQTSLQNIFLKGYEKNFDVMDGLNSLIESLYEANSYRSRGYEFLLGKKITSKVTSPYKRYQMYLRWMVRDDELDLGLWKNIDKSHLLAPLDTHTHKMALKFGLINRKTYDFKACMELTNTFRSFDKNDPIKYDFALYRLGQENIQL